MTFKAPINHIYPSFEKKCEKLGGVSYENSDVYVPQPTIMVSFTTAQI